MNTSGVHVEQFKALQTCYLCNFVGLVDAWFDPETRDAGWQCATCNTDHESNR